MRYIRKLIVVGIAVIALSACAGPTGLLSDINFSGQTAPIPENYREIVASQLLAVHETAEISTPQPGTPWSALEARGWYVCVRHSDLQIEAAYIGDKARVDGVIAAPTFCAPGTAYESYTRKQPWE